LDRPSTYCNNVRATDSNFYRCTSADVWYSPGLQSIIYAQEGTNINRIEFLQRFTFFIQNPFRSIFNTIINVIQPAFPGGQKFDFNFINNTQDFSRLYLNKYNSKAIHGVTENIGIDEFFSVAYYGFTADICASVDKYVQETGPVDIISCDNNQGTYFVETLNPTRFNTWKDFTAKVRVS